MCLLSFSAACTQCNLSSSDTSVWKLEKKINCKENKPALLLWFNQLPLSFITALFTIPPNQLCLTFFASCDILSDFWRCKAAGSFSLLGPYQPLPVSSGPAQLSESPSVPLLYLLTQTSAWQETGQTAVQQSLGTRHRNSAALLPQSTGSSLLSKGSPTSEPKCRPAHSNSAPSELHH